MTRIAWSLLIVAVLLVYACAGDQPAQREPAAASTPASHGEQLEAERAAPSPVTVKQADADLAAARKLVDDLKGDLHAAQGHVDALERARDQLVVDAARARLAWTAGLLQLAVIGWGALAFFSPVWRTRLVLAAVSTEAAAVIALALRAVYAWLPIAGAVVGVGFVAIAVWKTVKLVRAARAAADHGDRMEAALLGLKDWFTGDESLLHELVASVKVESAKAQQAAGVGKALALIRGADPKHSAAMAALPILRAKVAELPAKVLADPQPHDVPSQRVDLAPLVAKADAAAPEPPKAA